MILKRIFDFVSAAVILILLAPLLVILAIAIRMKMGSPVLYKQLRPGFKEKPFLIYKFRTMRDLRDETGTLRPDAQRLTSFGNFLRSASLDELPELYNVLRGDMSLVGPRPLLMQYLERYDSEQKRRHEVLPGITGWAQIHGRNAISWEERLKLDVWYVDNRSFWVDLKILFSTLQKMWSREGISAKGHATMPEFLGSNKD